MSKGLSPYITSLRFFISLSVILHFCFYVSVFIFDAPENQDSSEETVEFTYIEPKKDDGQIVEQSETRINDDIPEETKFKSRFNQRVVRQTKAANTGAFRNSAGRGGTGQDLAPKNTQQMKAKQAKQTQAKPQGLAAFAPKVDYAKLVQESATRKPTSQGQQASQSDDHLKDIEVGAQTILSTREFVYYAYYSRIKGKIRQYWEPSIKAKVSRLLREGRSIASNQSRKTRIIITLNDSGTLERVQVVEESGVRDLDDAAIEAFKAAAPFPNPPQGMVEGDGKIRIKWDFILEASVRSFEDFQGFA